MGDIGQIIRILPGELVTGLNLYGIKFDKINEIRIRTRSEERRVGKECRSRWSPYH